MGARVKRAERWFSPFFRDEAGSRCARLLCLDSGLASVGRQQVETASEAEPAKVEEWHRELVSSGNRARWRCAERRGGWWGAIRFAAVVGEGWQRQVMVYSYSQSGSGVR